ncbi:MAG: hypothetical protein KAX44_06080 [Candidatus Brocadiae bacterium]|nr:hypothetical protein [Candidatus Brocadiia bacterium]
MAPQLPSRPSLEHLKRQAKDLLKAHREGDRTACETLHVLRRFGGASDEDILASDVTLQEVQHALAVYCGFRNWSMLRKYCAQVKPLSHRIAEGHCDREYIEALQVSVTEVLGTSAVVAVGEQYLVRGEYHLAESDIEGIMLSNLGRATGKPCRISPGSAGFELTAEVLEVQPGKEDVLDILMSGRSGADLGVRIRLFLEGTR